MITHIPELMTVAPRFVYWRTGEAPQGKTVFLTVEPGTQLQITKVFSSDPSMKATLETIEDGKRYKVLITPEQTGQPRMAAVTVETVVSGNAQKSFSIYAHVKANSAETQ